MFSVHYYQFYMEMRVHALHTIVNDPDCVTNSWYYSFKSIYTWLMLDGAEHYIYTVE